MPDGMLCILPASMQLCFSLGSSVLHTDVVLGPRQLPVTFDCLAICTSKLQTRCQMSTTNHSQQ